MYKFYEFFTPVLEVMKDGKTYSRHEVSELVAQLLKLSDEQRRLTIKSGRPVYADRSQWAMTYLKQAGALRNEQRGKWQISDRGLDMLRQDMPVTLDALKQFPEFVDFQQRVGTRRKDTVGASGSVDGDISNAMFAENTPNDLMKMAHAQMQSSLQEELLDYLRSMDVYQFEEVVADLLGAMGYGDLGEVHVTKKSNDEGIDAIVSEDALGLSKIFAQAKRYGENNIVRKKAISDFVGALGMKNVDKGVFVTTSDFYDGVEQDVRATGKSIILINGDRLTELMIEHGVGVSVTHKYEVKRIDMDYFVG